MAKYASKRAAQFYAETYDVSLSDWPAEIDFYLTLAEGASANVASILELACGTGRVALRLGEAGFNVVGLDHSPPMLKIAQAKSEGITNMRWVLGDMRSFTLNENFDLIIIPGHAFQNLNSPEDQVSCLKSIRQHLKASGTLVIHLDHQNVAWLGEISADKKGVFEAAEQFRHPTKNSQIQTSRAWSYEPSTQTAIVETTWLELDSSGQVINRVESGPIRLHCLFRFEMEHCRLLMTLLT
jgi:SAM-dependent methyltransferase